MTQRHLLIVVVLLTNAIPARSQTPEGMYQTPLPSTLLDEVRALLPPGQAVADHHPHLLDGNINPNLQLPEPATVAVTFLDERSPWRNAFGYFVYDENNVLLEAAPIFRNCSELGGGGDLVPGDTLDIGPFPGNAKVGFYLIDDGYDASVTMPDAAGGRPVLHTIDALNAAGRRHVAMISCEAPLEGYTEAPFILAFEDEPDGSGDRDFNDLIALIQVTPESIRKRVRDLGDIPGSDLPLDSDGDGIGDAEDEFPNDPNLAFLQRTPAVGRNYFLVFEDNYPRVGDGDYNDFVVAFHGEQFLDADNRVRKIRLLHAAVARGASFRHAFRHRIRLAEGLTVYSEVRRYDRDWQLDETLATTHHTVADLRIFPSTHEAVRDDVSGSKLPNTEPNAPQVQSAYTETILSFDHPVPVGAFEPLPADPYLYLWDTQYDIHLPGREPIPGSPNPTTTVNGAFIDANGYPFAMLVPVNWAYPEAGVFIQDAYPQFEAWRTSEGALASDWFDFPGAFGTRSYELILPE